MTRMASHESTLDRLYQLPLDEFRNAGEIKALTKPPVAAWAVNQLYWQDRKTWDALIDAAENLRRTHKAVLSGRAGDVRAAGAAHDAAVQDALKATLALLTKAGHPATDAARQAIVNTLRALPSDDAPGRLTRALQPGGFEMLAGLSIPPRASAAAARPAAPAKHTEEEKPAARSKADAKALTQAREAAASADRALKDAEQGTRRHEFEIARATRDEERAAKAVEQARAALDQAKVALAEAERAEKDAARRREAAEAGAKKSSAEVDAARRTAQAAAAALKKLQAHG